VVVAAVAAAVAADDHPEEVIGAIGVLRVQVVPHGDPEDDVVNY
jgi:hypothetical protein